MIINVSRASGISKDWGRCLTRRGAVVGVKDGASSATQMDPGRERMQSISPPTSLPTPFLLPKSHWSVSLGETWRQAQNEIIKHKLSININERLADVTSSHQALYLLLQQLFFFFAVNGNAVLDISVLLWASSFLCLYSFGPELLPSKFPFMISFSRPGTHYVEWSLHSRKGHHPVDSAHWSLLLCCPVSR